MDFRTNVKSLNKGELFQAMMNNGSFHRMGNTPFWKRAFELYTENTGEKVDLGCSRCYTKVKEWLQKV
jgi:hypothetical protein